MSLLGSLRYIASGPGLGRMCEIVEIISPKKVRVKVLPRDNWDNTIYVGQTINKMIDSLLIRARDEQLVEFRGRTYKASLRGKYSPTINLCNLEDGYTRYWGVFPGSYRVFEFKNIGLYE